MHISIERIAFKAANQRLKAVIALEGLAIDLPTVALEDNDRAFRNTSKKELGMISGKMFRLGDKDDALFDVASTDEAKVLNLDFPLRYHEVQRFYAAKMICQWHRPNRELVRLIAWQRTDGIGVFNLDIVAYPNDLVISLLVDHLEGCAARQKSFAAAKPARKRFNGDGIVQQNINCDALLDVLWSNIPKLRAFEAKFADRAMRTALSFAYIRHGAIISFDDDVFIFQKTEVVDAKVCVKCR